MSVLFYNAGDKIDEMIAYSIPSGHDIHCTAKWHLLAPAKEFFEVPTEVELKDTGEIIGVQFAADITRKFGEHGVVRFDPNWDHEKEDPDKPLQQYARSNTREGMIRRGMELREAYLRKVVESHLNDCEAARAAGGAPRRAQGFTKKALRELGISDPGDEHFNALRNGQKPAGAADPAIASLQAQNAMLMQMVLAIASGKPIDPEALKKMAETPNAVGVSESGQVITSGVATGEIKKPIGTEETYETLKKQPRGKSQRHEAARECLEGHTPLEQ